MKQFLVYWIWPNPAGWNYGDPKIKAAIILFLVMIVLSFMIRFWRTRLKNPVTRNLSASWSRSLFWFAVVALFLIVSRVEEIQFLAMRLLWIFWFVSFFLYLFFQLLQFRRRHYTVLKRVQVVDEREKYLPRRNHY